MAAASTDFLILRVALLNRWGGYDYQSFSGFQQVTGLENLGYESEQVNAGGFTGNYEQVMQLLKSQPK